MTTPTIPYSSAVTRIRRQVTGTDTYGNDIRTPVSTVLPGAVVWPRTSTEVEGERDTVTTDLILLVPASGDVRPTDKFTVGGNTYQVQGEPYDWRSPLTNSRAGTQATLRRVTG